FGLTFVQEWIQMLLSGSVSPRTESVPSVGVVLSRTIMIAVIYVLSACCAILPKERWAAARRAPGEERPVLFYFVASTAAVALGLVVSFVFGLVTQLDVNEAWALFVVRYPWALMSFVTAFVTAWLADDPPSSMSVRHRQRWGEGGVQAAASVVTAVLVLTWLGQVPQPANLPTTYHLPDPLSVLVRAALIGFVIGYKVPTWYREAPREPEATPASAALALPALH